MNELTKLTKRKKTFIVLAVIVLLGVVEGLNIWEVPERVWIGLGLFGWGFFKAGVNRVEVKVENIVSEVKELMTELDKKIK